jgi:hypothetical protein
MRLRPESTELTLHRQQLVASPIFRMLRKIQLFGNSEKMMHHQRIPDMGSLLLNITVATA